MADVNATALDVWDESREVSRSEAIRRLVELGLKVKVKGK
jgi:hypothetical protein